MENTNQPAHDLLAALLHLIAAEVERQLAPLQSLVSQLQQELADIWVDQQEAEQLTGRSYSWFYARRQRNTLPIRMLPATEGSRKLRYSRTDCIRYAEEHCLRPVER